MIIENGYISFKVKSTAKVSDNGFLTKPASEQWSAVMPCQISQNSASKNEVVNGEHYANASYTILVELDEPIISEQVVLYDDGFDVIGEYSIASTERLASVGIIRIVV